MATQIQWEDFCKAHPQLHILQTNEWGILKSHFGWTPEYIVNNDSGALVLFRKIVPGITMGYIPKFSAYGSLSILMREIDDLCAEKRACFVKIEPDVFEPANLTEFDSFGLPSRTVQPRRTIIIDLRGNEETWLGRMKQKTRYNIRLAEKKGIKIQESLETDAFNQIMRITSERDAFETHSPNYYFLAFELFRQCGNCVLLEATYEQKVLAAVMIFKRGNRAWYFYGASSDEHRHLMPTFLLQFHAMRWAAENGCCEYDLWGIPDYDEDFLENNFTKRTDGLWGVYRFKRGFGGRVTRSVTAIDRIYSKSKYQAYSWLRSIRGRSDF